MKKQILISILTAFALLLNISTFAQSEKSSTTASLITDVTSADYLNAAPLSLAEILLRQPKIYTSNKYVGEFVLRGRLPLYVIDNQRIGNNFARAASAISPFDIESVEVITDPTRTLIYGKKGGNGVILIRSKRS